MTPKIMRKIGRGDALTNAELLAALEHLTELVPLLLTMGPTFLLAFKEANRLAIELTGYARSRGLIPYPEPQRTP